MIWDALYVNSSDVCLTVNYFRVFLIMTVFNFILTVTFKRKDDRAEYILSVVSCNRKLIYFFDKALNTIKAISHLKTKFKAENHWIVILQEFAVKFGIIFMNELNFPGIRVSFRKKTNRGQMTWIVQTNEKIIFFFKSNDKKHKNGRFSPTEQNFF